MKKRGIILSDLHCGSVVGLTHPRYQLRTGRGESYHRRNKLAGLQRETWAAFTDLLKRHAPYDLVFLLGDLIDGKGHRSGGTEQLTADLEEQSQMAVDCIDQVRGHGKRTTKMIGVYGTPYHVSPDGEDWENVIATRAGIDKLGAHEWPEVNGCIFDLKHKVGGSTIPHGRATSILKEQLWNDIWSLEEMQPRSAVLCRGHVHYHQVVGSPSAGGMRWAMTLPALQAMGTKYGSRQCSGIVHWGAIPFTVDDAGRFDFTSEIVTIHAQKAKTLKL